jgi:hypothetical protein
MGLQGEIQRTMMLSADVVKQARVLLSMSIIHPCYTIKRGLGSLVDHNQGTGQCAKCVPLNLTSNQGYEDATFVIGLTGPADCNSISNRIAVS